MKMNQLTAEERLIAVNNGKAIKRALKKKRRPVSEIEIVRRQASGALRRLRQLALTDAAALNCLVDELALHLNLLKHEPLTSTKHYRKLIRRCSTWPAFVSVDKEHQAKQIRFARNMELGADSSLNYTGRQWSRRTPEVRVALQLTGFLELSRRKLKLPPLTRATAPLWWNKSRKLFEKIYGKDFENRATFSHYKEGHKEWEESGLTQKTWIRKRILDKMRQAFVSIARKN